jgi:hypothetical protein
MSSAAAFGPDATATVSLSYQAHTEDSLDLIPILTSTHFAPSVTASTASGTFVSLGSVGPGIYEISLETVGEISGNGNAVQVAVGGAVKWQEFIPANSQVIWVRRFRLTEASSALTITQNGGVNFRGAINKVD